MYQIVPDKRIWLYHCVEQRWMCLFNSIDDVVRFIAEDLRHKKDNMFLFKSERDQSEFLERICMNINECNKSVYEHYDKLGWSEIEWSVLISVPCYMYIDADNRVIDMRLYRKEIERIAYSDEPNNYQSTSFSKRRGSRRRWHEHENYKYRQTAVPGTGKKWRRHTKVYRHVKTTQELRYNTNPEYEPFVRNRRKHLPTVYDDIVIEKSKSWKDCTKRKNQWKERTKHNSSFSFTTFTLELLI